MGLLDRCVEKMERGGMERITAENENGKAYYPTCFARCDGAGASGKCNYCDFEEKICETIRAYENTGLTPEQIYEISEMYKELATELGKCKKALEEMKHPAKKPIGAVS